jgi:protease II
MFVRTSCPISTRTPHASEAPQALRTRQVTSAHGRELVDDYGWLRDKDDPCARLPGSRAAYDRDHATDRGIQDALYKEMLARIKGD